MAGQLSGGGGIKPHEPLKKYFFFYDYLKIGQNHMKHKKNLKKKLHVMFIAAGQNLSREKKYQKILYLQI